MAAKASDRRQRASYTSNFSRWHQIFCRKVLYWWATPCLGWKIRCQTGRCFVHSEWRNRKDQKTTQRTPFRTGTKNGSNESGRFQTTLGHRLPAVGMGWRGAAFLRYAPPFHLSQTSWHSPHDERRSWNYEKSPCWCLRPWINGVEIGVDLFVSTIVNSSLKLRPAGLHQRRGRTSIWLPARRLRIRSTSSVVLPLALTDSVLYSMVSIYPRFHCLP